MPDTLVQWFGLDLTDAVYTPSFMTGDDTFFVNEYITGIVVLLSTYAILAFARTRYAINNPIPVALDPGKDGLENLSRYITERKLVGLN